MKLPDFTHFEPFNNLRKLMGATLTDIFSLEASSVLSMSDLEVMKTTGKDVDINEIRTLEDGTLAYKNTRVLLYIRDVNTYHTNFSLPKFHVAECKTIKNKRSENKIERYVVSNRTDGKFNINLMTNNNPEPQLSKLEVCMNCLEHLTYKNFRNKNEQREVRDNFSIVEYFELFPQTFFISAPKHTCFDAPVNRYPKNMKEISRKFRQKRGYICEICKIDLSAEHLQRFSHVNHKNGLKNDNSESNFEALCIYCHAEQGQAHIKNLPDYKSFLLIREELMANIF